MSPFRRIELSKAIIARTHVTNILAVKVFSLSEKSCFISSSILFTANNYECLDVSLVKKVGLTKDILMFFSIILLTQLQYDLGLQSIA